MAAALRITHECIAEHLRKKTGLAKPKAQTGAVTLIQRFGGSINLNVHFHQLFIDGAYEIDGESAVFHPAAPPTREEIAVVLAKVIRRLARHLERRGIIEKDQELQIDLDDDSFAKLQAGAVSYRFALGPNKGKKALTLKTVPELDHNSDYGLIAKEAGFSLHAGVAIAGGEREKLEKICRYVARPPIALERLRLNERGEVIYGLKKPYSDGTTHIKMQPLELMEKLAALVPRPRVHLTRFHGILAPHSKHRRLVVPAAPTSPPLSPVAADGTAEIEPTPGNPPAAVEPLSPARISWARLLKRVFGVDVETCAACGGKNRIVAAIEDPPVIRKILGHLELPIRPPPIWPADRGPPLGSAFDDEFSQSSSFAFE